MAIRVDDYSSAKVTSRGTKIVTSGDNLDKNSFLKILAAELANQDPTQDVDSAQYVTQLAQFTSLEQMSNLNDVMTKNSYNDLVGKGVTVSDKDANGQCYTGVVYSVNTNTTPATLSLQVNEDGKNVYKKFNISNVISVVNVEDYSIPPLTSISGTTSFLLASSFMDKQVELSEKDEDGNALTGKVVGVVKDNGYVNVRVELASGEVKEYSYDKVVKVGDFVKSSTTEDSKTK
ncbi:MAG: flagellar biosynthesis protein FlgD [Clostridium sp.]|nr:flagellar biosynthesis protein FlgD [Clostridium sp.]